MGQDTVALAVIGLVVSAILFWVVKKAAQEAYLFCAVKKAAQESARQDRQQNVQEANRLLKELNKSLGFPEGTGPTGIMVDGQYRVVHVGHTKRMKNDPVYAFGNEMAGIIMEIGDLENALKEAQASNDTALARSISNELQALERKAERLAIERKAHTSIDKNQRGITMSDLIDMRAHIMEQWEEALNVARGNGYWRDVEACTGVIESFHDLIREAILSEGFSGDAKAALQAWDNAGDAERKYRRIAETSARLEAPVPDGSAW
jgi:hypothetical protein